MTADGVVNLPHSRDAEESIIGQMLAKPDVISEVVTTLLEPDHFYLGGSKILYEEIVESYYADDPIDPISIGEKTVKRLTRIWGIDEKNAMARVQEFAAGRNWAGSAASHAVIVKNHADYRELLNLATAIQRSVHDESKHPQEIAGLATQTAMEIATSTVRKHELVSYGDLGRRFYHRAQILMAAREQGIELGAYFGLAAVDDWLRGLQPTELLISAGVPGAGKSAVWWAAAKKFAERQMKKPPDKRIGTLVLSLEMGEAPSADRLATELSEIDGGVIREGKLAAEQLETIRKEWGSRKDLPLWFDFSSTVRASQMRAIVAEAIKRYKVGVVIVDHYRHWDLDRRPDSSIQEDDDKAKFLKEQIAKDLNVAVICIAHTTKTIDTPDGRPRLAHLRGSGQISAFADCVNFLHRPYENASEKEKADVHPFTAEFIYEKNRNGLTGIAPFRFDPSRMAVY